MKTVKIYTQSELSIIAESLTVDPVTGYVYYKPLTREHFKTDKSFISWNKKAGQRAGSLSSAGYRNLCVRGVAMQEHRAVFFLTHGVMPDVIDHIDGDKSNNRPANLRSCTHKDNLTYHYTKLSKTSKHHSRVKRPIVSIDPVTKQIVNYYPSVNSAGRHGFSVVTIAHVLAGRGKKSGGFYWDYAENHVIEAA